MTGFTFVWLVCRWEVFTEGKTLPSLPILTSPWICPLCPQQHSALQLPHPFGEELGVSASQLCTFSSLCHEMCVCQEVPFALQMCQLCFQSRVQLLIPQFLPSLLCQCRAGCLHCAGRTLGSFLPVLRIQLLVSSLAEALSMPGMLWDS